MKLTDVIEIIGGGTPKTSCAEYWNGDILWLSVNDFNNDNRYVYSTEKTITQSGLEHSSAKLLKKDDIIISARGTVGEMAMIPFPMAFNQSCYGIRGKECIDNTFLYYFLKNNINKLKVLTHGSVFDTITKNTFAEIEIDLPDLETQKKISSVLSILDDKIELNNKINKNLEEQAQAIFKSWFIDFEPFGNVMPENWRTGTVSEIIELHDSKRIPLSSAERDKMQKIYAYYGATSKMDYVDNYLFDGIYLLLGEDGTVINSEGFPVLQYVYGKFWVNNHAHVITGKSGYTVEILYLLFKQTNIRHAVTGAVQQKISQANLKKVSVIIPDIQSLEKFNEIIQPLFLMIRKNRDEIERLSALRDTLLPELMGGKVKIP